MLTERDCRMIVEYLCDALKCDTELQDVMARAMTRCAKKKEKLVKLSEAAQILGVSKSLLYHIKDNFSYVKTGDSKTSHILFKESCLFDEFEAYLCRKRKTVQFGPLRKVM